MTQGTIHQVNGVNVSTQEEFESVVSNTSVGDNVSFWTSEGNFTVQAVEHEDHDDGYIGIRYAEAQSTVVKDSYSNHQSFFQWFVSLLWTVGLLNLMIGLFNMLPIKPLDGGLMTETLMEKYVGEDSIKYLNNFSAIGWLLIIGAILAAVLGL
jgi:Peptidase family M50.